MANYNGKIQNVRRRYNSLKNFVGKNEVHLAGDILYVSTKNDDDYDLILYADGKSKFLELYKRYTDGGSTIVPPGSIGENELTEELRQKINEAAGGQIGPNSVGSDEIINGGIQKEDLNDEVKEGLDELNNISITDDELEEIFYPNQGENQDAGFDTGADEADPDDI